MKKLTKDDFIKKIQIIRDSNKDKYCKLNKINLLRIPYDQNIEELLTAHIDLRYT